MTQVGSKGLHLPVEGHGGTWEGLAGFSRWHSTERAVNRITRGQPVVFEGGYPDFSPWSRKEYFFDHLTGANADFTAADRLLADELRLPDRAAAAQYRRRAKLTWHHHQDGHRLILLPRALHSKVPHMGGATMLRALDRADGGLISEPAQNTRLQAQVRAGIPVELPIRPAPRLGKRGWDPQSHATLTAWLAEVAQNQALTNAVAVFDWDHTAIAGECGPVVWHFMLENLAMQIPPEKLGELLPEPPTDLFKSGLSAAALREDITAAYAELWPLRGNVTAARKLPAYRNFTSKVGAYCEAYDAVSPTLGKDGPLWMRWFTGFKPEALGALSVQAYRARLSRGLTRRTWTSAQAGKAGAVRYGFEDGLVGRPDIIDLMRAMRGAGIKPCIVTGGVEPMVQALVAAMGYPVQAGDIVGTRYERDDTGHLTQRLLCNAERPATYGPGKTACIRQFIGAAPVFVAGDSDGDYDMLTAFPETQVRLVVHADRDGKIASLYEPSGGNPRQLVQYSDGRTGQFVPHIPGKTTPKPERLAA